MVAHGDEPAGLATGIMAESILCVACRRVVSPALMLQSSEMIGPGLGLREPSVSLLFQLPKPIIR